MHFLAGNYVISEHNNFSSFNTSYIFNILPYVENKRKVVIECKELGGIEFRKIVYLDISAITIISCTLNLTSTSSGRIKITNCLFTSSTIIAQVCTFTSRAINCMDRNFGANRQPLYIIDTKFFNTSMEYSTTVGTSSALKISSIRLHVRGCQFVQNVATFGGAIYSEYSIIVISNTVFKNNSAEHSGGALYCVDTKLEISHSQFHNNTARVSGGALYHTGGPREILAQAYENRFLLFRTNFAYNRAELQGGAVHCQSNLEENISGKFSISFFNFNSAVNGGFAYLSNCQITIDGIKISYNSAINGGAYYTIESTIEFESEPNNTISYNRAREKGGALFLRRSQIKLLSAGIHILFDNNVVTSAKGRGGAIFVLDNSCDAATYYSENHCFVYYYIRVYHANLSEKLLVFKENRASRGSVLYGGLLDRCHPPKGYRHNNDFNIISEFKQLSVYEQGPLAISSEAIGVCLCVNDSHLDCILEKK